MKTYSQSTGSRILSHAIAMMTGLGVLVSTSSCASPGSKTGIGAGAGAATGAAIGGATGGWKGAALGGLLGGGAGAGFGNLLDKQADELSQVAQTERTEKGILVQLKNDLLFDTDSSNPKPEAVQQISKLGRILAQYKNDKIQVQGYTDSTGSKPYNEALSLRRAETVKNLLAAQGVADQQIQVSGFGPTRPIAKNDNPKGRAINRRVEIHIQMPQSSQS